MSELFSYEDIKDDVLRLFGAKYLETLDKNLQQKISKHVESVKLSDRQKNIYPTILLKLLFWIACHRY